MHWPSAPWWIDAIPDAIHAGNRQDPRYFVQQIPSAAALETSCFRNLGRRQMVAGHEPGRHQRGALGCNITMAIWWMHGRPLVDRQSKTPRYHSAQNRDRTKPYNPYSFQKTLDKPSRMRYTMSRKRKQSSPTGGCRIAHNLGGKRKSKMRRSDQQIIADARDSVISREGRGESVWSPRRASAWEIAEELGGNYVPLDESFAFTGIWPAQGGTRRGRITLPSGRAINVTEVTWWHGGENSGGWVYDCRHLD